MADTPASPPSVNRRAGRGLLLLGIVLAVLAVASVFGQWGVGITLVPWQLPIVTAVGALLVLWSLLKRFTVVRSIAFVLLVALAGFEGFAIAVGGKLPQYTGPAQAGKPMPPFRTTLADGRSFTDADMQDGRRRVLTFYRGRW